MLCTRDDLTQRLAGVAGGAAVGGDFVFGGGEGEGEFADLAADGVAMFEQHVESFGYGLLAAVDERDVVLQIADGHAGQPHPGEEDESAYRLGLVAAVSAAVAIHL